MKTALSFALIAIGLILGMIINSEYGVRQADAQPPAQVTRSTFQISAYAGPNGDGFGHGCYILDSGTGELWHARHGGSLEKVSDKIR